MNKSFKYSIALAFTIFGCSTSQITQTNPKSINKESNIFDTKSFQEISENDCNSANGYSHYRETGEYEYPWKDYIVSGHNGTSQCLTGKNEQGYYDISPRTCISLRDWSGFKAYRENKHYNINYDYFNDYYEVLEYLKVQKVPVRAYAGCFFDDPVPPPDDSGYGNPYGNPDDGNISYSGSYEPFEGGMYTLSVNINNSNCSQ